MKKAKHKQGFTLLELLVVMVILGVLVTIGLRSFTTSQMRARDSRRKSDLEQLANALELYRTDKGHYPVSDGEGQIVASSAAETTDEITYEWGEPFSDPDNEETIYMGNLPQDPSGLQYFYQPKMLVEDNTEAKAYRIYAFLENPQSPDRVAAEDLPDDGVFCRAEDTNFTCNYFISTPNLTN